jgi:hypothetical protein
MMTGSRTEKPFKPSFSQIVSHHTGMRPEIVEAFTNSSGSSGFEATEIPPHPDPLRAVLFLASTVSRPFSENRIPRT